MPSVEDDKGKLAESLRRYVHRGSFEGACLDTGASRTVMGADQASAYARLVGAQPPVAPTRVTLCRFGGEVYESRGTLSVHIPLSPTFYLPLHVDVVPLDVPLLLGLDTLDKYGLYVNNVTNYLVSDGRGIAVPLQRKGGHIYLVWGADVHY